MREGEGDRERVKGRLAERLGGRERRKSLLIGEGRGRYEIKGKKLMRKVEDKYDKDKGEMGSRDETGEVNKREEK